MGIRLLGPVELRHGTGADDGTDSAVPVGSAQRRAVLALLALELGRTVAVGQLLELLWAERPPTRAKAALQGHVATLRRLLDGSGLAITTSAPGYRLTGHPEAVDALHAEALAARAAATDDDTTAAALLERALRLWRGAALADLPATPLAAALAARLDDTRTELLTAWTRCLLRLGRGHAAVPALEQSVRADGLREPTAALLVRCLHQSGRGADAVRLHRQATARLDEELGVGPGPELRAALAELTEAGEALTDGAPTIRHFPSAPDGFVGREAEERWLDHHGRAEQGGGGLAVVVGPAGVGKSATVLRWAHRAAAGFPDGRLFADLRGFDPAGPADPAQILGRFLRSLGLPEQAVPEGLAARADLFRALTRRRRLLVVLDNVRTAAEATELLPAGPACVTVLTSRNTLEELVVTDGAALLHIDALPASDAHRLLEHRLTAERVAAEPAAAARLIELCDRLPLALQITADRLAARPGWELASLVDELADERTRLTALRTDGGAVSVRTALSRTYPHLPGPARRLLALLTVHPGTTTDVSAAAALLAADAETARHALGSLAAHHLLTEPAPGRYGRHDLVRLYGAELFDGLPAERRDTAFQRLADYELAAGGHAVQRTNPHYRPYRPPGPGPQALPRLSDVRATLDWCRAEEPVLRALVTAAADRGDHERAWRLAEVTAVLYYGADRVVDRLSCLRAGLHAARLDGGREGLAAMEAATACALGTVGYVAEALPLAARAVDRTTPEDGDRHIHALSVLSSMTALSGDPAEADRISRAALVLVRSSGLRQHAATILSNAAAIKLTLGDPAAALAHAHETHTLLPHRPSANAAIWAVVSEALAHQSLGDRDRAELAWHDALHRCRSTGNVRLHALAHRQFAEFLTVGGRSAEAATHHHAAAELYTAHGDAPRAEHLDRQLVEPARRTAPR